VPLSNDKSHVRKLDTVMANAARKSLGGRPPERTIFERVGANPTLVLNFDCSYDLTRIRVCP